jgi:hypothetical protein
VPFLFSGTHLRQEDFRSQAWKRLSQHINERVDELRKLNDSPSYGVEQTALIRGGIRELTKILSLADEASLSQAVDPEELLSVGTPGQQ